MLWFARIVALAGVRRARRLAGDPQSRAADGAAAHVPAELVYYRCSTLSQRRSSCRSLRATASPLPEHTAVRPDDAPLEILDILEEPLAQALEIGAGHKCAGRIGAVDQPTERHLRADTRLGIPGICDAHTQAQQAGAEFADRELDI